MRSIKQSFYNQSPVFLKNILVTIYNLRFVEIFGDKYQALLKETEKVFYRYSLDELKALQNKKFMDLIEFASKNNPYYQDILKNKEIKNITDISKLPFLIKEDLRKDAIRSKIKAKILQGNTGGTTGHGLSYGLTLDDYIQRQATLNFFRGMFGYKYKDKIAWFSGKEIITEKEANKKIFWVKDYLSNITYYSTFHLRNDYIDAMIVNLNKSQVQYFAGFPSAIYDIAKRWEQSGIEKKLKLKAIFPTSEPLHDYQKQFLKKFFECPVPDQYASSEGAPFIYECPEERLHYDMSSGIFEKISEQSDEVAVTSFTTHYMPLIRYKIGDSISFGQENNCSCGSKMPIINSIEGRSVAYVYSKERGKITVSNISNVVKYMTNVEKLQLVQNNVDAIDVYVVSSSDKTELEKNLEYELRYRLGDKIKLNYYFVANIPLEKSGKFLMIKNTMNQSITDQNCQH